MLLYKTVNTATSQTRKVKMSLKNWYEATPQEIREEAGRRRFIPQQEFEIVLDHANIPTADIVVTREVGGRLEFLLAKRTEGAWKNQFFIPGGRIPPGVLPADAAKMNCGRELGFIPDESPKFVGFMSVLNPERTSGPKPWFSLWCIFEVRVPETVEIHLNRSTHENMEYQWFTEILPSFPEPTRKALQMVGFENAR